MTTPKVEAAPPTSEPTPADSTADELRQWSDRRSTMADRLAEIDLELVDAASTLTEARREAIMGADRAEAIAAQIGRQRALAAERDELTERVALADVEIAVVQRRANSANAIAIIGGFAARAREISDEATASDDRIVELIVGLQHELADRFALWQRDQAFRREIDQARSGMPQWPGVDMDDLPSVSLGVLENVAFQPHKLKIPPLDAPRYRIEV